MLAIQQPKQQLEQCSPNVLPCRINSNGPCKVTKRFWLPSFEKDKTSTVYFRGRKLRGRVVKLPEGYEGIIATSTDQLLPNEPAKASPAIPEDSDLEELDDEETTEPVKILNAFATFNEVIVWSHDQVPAAEDTFVKGIDEWIAFAEAIHSGPTQEEDSGDQPGS